MKARDFFAKMWDAVLGFLGGVVLVICCNPLVMFFFNLFFPENAARFVREFIGFAEFWRDFYTRNALKWPYWWAQEWMTKENLHLCSPKKQVLYYQDNLNRSSVLKAMSSEAQVYLVRKHSEYMTEIIGLMRLTDDMFAEWLRQIVKKGYKPHPCGDPWWRNLYSPLDYYLRTGKIPFSQVMILTRMAVAEHNNSSCPLSQYLYDYIERFGLNKKQLEEIAQYMCDNLYWHDVFAEEATTEAEKEHVRHEKFRHFYNFLSEHQENYDQRVFARSHRLSNHTEEWKTFCSNAANICPAAQKEMDINQYTIFHEAGHKLSTKAIVYFLEYPDRMLHRLVFRYEPVDVFEHIDVQHVINGNIYLKGVFDEEVAKRKLEEETRKKAAKSDTDSHLGPKIMV